MSSLSQFIGGNLPPTAIVNGFSTDGYTVPVADFVTNRIAHGIKSILSGALTAATLKTLLSITGGGVLKYCGLAAVDATSRTLRLRITIDGTVVFDSTSAASTIANAGCHAVGSHQFVTATAGAGTRDRISFATSLLIEVASSLSETDKLSLGVIYEEN